MVKDRRLILQNYHISHEHCSALVKYILDPANDQLKLETIVIDDCGIDDHKMNDLLYCILQ